MKPIVENSSLLRQGLIIVSGPRGSGKKSLTYSLLESIPRNNLNVLTIEQTHLYRLKHVSQFEFGPNIDYYQALQACLKQDPDILVIDNLIGAAMVDQVIKASARCLIIAGVNNYNSLSALQSLESSDIEAFRLAHRPVSSSFSGLAFSLIIFRVMFSPSTVGKLKTSIL